MRPRASPPVVHSVRQVLDKGEFAGFAQHIQSELSELMGTHLEAHAESAAKAAIAGVHVDSGMEKGSASVDFPVIGDLDSSIGFWAAFVNSLIMIIVTELGDKTFFIAAVLAMRQVRSERTNERTNERTDKANQRSPSP